MFGAVVVTVMIDLDIRWLCICRHRCRTRRAVVSVTDIFATLI